MPKPGSSKQIITHSQTKQKSISVPQTHIDTCICPQVSHSESVHTQTDNMNEEQQQAFKDMFTEMCNNLREEMAKESQTQRAHLTNIETRIDKKPSSSGIKPDVFDGNPAVDAITWFDSFTRIANINNWSKDNQLNALPLYLSGVVHAWFLSLTDEVKSDFGQLKAAFQARFASQDWILSQQLSTRKQAKGERIDDYIADITRICKRLKLSDADSVRYFTRPPTANSKLCHFGTA